MKVLLAVVGLLLASVASAKLTSAEVKTLPDGTLCGCEDTSLCNLVTKKHPKEVFAFQLNATDWPLWDWTRLTTVVQYAQGMEPKWDMYCHARSKDVRVVPANIFQPWHQLTNKTFRLEWIDKVVAQIVKYNWDGINLDQEKLIHEDDSQMRDALTEFMVEFGERLRPAVKGGGQFTFDVGYKPPPVGTRWYDYRALMYLTDFVIVMDYDTRSQFFNVSKCYGGPNAPINTAITGIEEFLALYNDSSKLVLGVPWYGYVYNCTNQYEGPDTPCEIAWTNPPYRGCNCSDAVGREHNYKSLHRLVKNQPIGEFNYTLLGNVTVNVTDCWARQNFHWTGGSAPFYSTWFDTPATLKTKYRVAKDYNLRGISMWNLNAISTARTAEGVQERKEMWEAMDVYLH